MNDANWQSLPSNLTADDDLEQAVLEVYKSILREQLAWDPMLKHALPVMIRALRRIDTWRVLLLLTPWMLVRLLFPDEPPELEVPPGWFAHERRDAPYLVLGPNLSFDLLTQSQQAHLNYHHHLGHYLLQPICLDMGPYESADAVFAAWNQVIRIRDENMAQAKRDCPLQKDIARRELFRRFTDPGKGTG